MKKNCRDFLLEINVEELPVGYVRPALGSLQNAFLKEFKALGIDCGQTYLAGTANSLILYIKDVSLQQKKLSSEVLGPPKSVAFDKKGNPTIQGRSFAKAHGVKVEDLRIKETAKGEYVVVDKNIKAPFTKDILRETIPGIIKDIYFPKTMRWDNSGLRFARPIESILLLFGKDGLNIKIGGVPQKKIKSISPLKYLALIQKKSLIDPDERKKEIKRLMLRAAKRLKSDPFFNEELLEEVNFMVSDPQIFVGGFNKKFLTLPDDVLKASMSKYQRIFPVLKKGRIVNKFIAVIDGGGRDIKGVKENYEKILEARLQDSLFFLNEDTKKPLSENVTQLKDLIFQKDLGNMFEKIERLKKLCSFICEKLNLKGPSRIDIERAAWLSKLDLVTHMVGEFPSLQGVMGGEYALRGGEKSEVAQAITEQYLPQGMDAKLPKSLEGAILAVGDRIDNIVGLMGMGVDTSGSFDPFGIRRNAQGLVQIILDKSLRLGIDELIQKGIVLYSDKLNVSATELKNKIIDYIKERIEFLTGAIKPIELKQAVLGIRCFDVFDIFKRIEELSSISDKRYFLETAKVVERTSNILKGAKRENIPEVREGLFKEDAEREVWKAYSNIKETIEDLINKERYREATKEYANAFFKVLHDFFDKVLVNADDASLRSNRLAIMKAINRLYTERIADLALLPQIVVK